MTAAGFCPDAEYPLGPVQEYVAPVPAFVADKLKVVLGQMGPLLLAVTVHVLQGGGEV